MVLDFCLNIVHNFVSAHMDRIFYQIARPVGVHYNQCDGESVRPSVAS